MNGWSAWNASTVWSLVLIALTIVIHAVGVVIIALAIERAAGRRRAAGSLMQVTGFTAIGIIVAVALSLVILHGIECFAWAYAYVQLGALPNPADALLYSVDSMTTRGSSGLRLEQEWRMMGAVEAGDGMLLFGVSTAFLFYLMQRLWRYDSR